VVQLKPVPDDSERRGRAVLDRHSLVLNRSWVPVHVTTVRRALCMVFQTAARVVATDSLQTHDFEDWLLMGEMEGIAHQGWVRAGRCRIPAPEVVQLLHYDRIPAHDAPFTRRNLYQRDDYTCQYCGRRTGAERLSIDHVTPRSKGGRTCWENCVLACVRCNTSKADRTLKESGLRLLRQPRRPRWSPYLSMTAPDRLESWQRFTPASLWDAGDLRMSGS
jgi:5-methylcytosine-specific restriction endonuclease McrA